MSESVDRFAVEREVAQLLLQGPTESDLRRAAGLLGTRLHEISADEQFWASVRRTEVPSVDRHQLAMLLAIDWTPLLGAVDYQPPPPLESVGWELVQATKVAATSDSRADWDDLQSRIAWLADQLDHDAESGPMQTETFWRRLKRKVATAWNVVRRVDLVTVLTESLKRALEEGTKVWISGADEHAIPLLIASVLIGTAIELGKELRRAASDATEDDHRKRWDSYPTETLELAKLGGTKADFGYLGILFRTVYDPVTWKRVGEEEVTDKIYAIRSWEAEFGARLASEWPFVAEEVGPAGISELDQMSAGLRELRESLEALQRAWNERDERQWDAGFRRGSTAFDQIEGSVQRLLWLFEQNKLIKHNGEGN